MPDPLHHGSTAVADPPSRHPVLVIAPSSTRRAPDVFLASEVYEDAQERVFVDHDHPGVLHRLPLGTPVTTRVVRHGAPPPTDAHGERRLMAEILRAQDGSRSELAPPVDLPGALKRTLRRGAETDSRRLAALLAATDGPELVYDVLSECLACVGEQWSRGAVPVLTQRRTSRIADAICADLRAACPVGKVPGSVVLAVPPGEQHTLALEAVGHLLAMTGRHVEIVGDLPLPELCELAADPGVTAVVLSAHVTLTLSSARRLLSRLRAAAPAVLLVAGGPGFPRTGGATAADVVTDDVGVLRDVLEERLSGLTGRERDVIRGLADGQSNAEIAATMNVAPSTVKTHLDHIYDKTRTSHRTAAVAHAFRQGWLR